MNIFILDKNITLSAQYHCDKHVVKMITESCQILCTVYLANTNYKSYPDFLYKPTHTKHPCVLWAGANISNFCYLVELAEALYNEYQYRYNRPEKHQRNKNIIDYFKKVLPPLILEKQTPFAQAMPDKYKHDNPVVAYRAYYNGEKHHLFKWTKRNIPIWIQKIGLKFDKLTTIWYTCRNDSYVENSFEFVKAIGGNTYRDKEYPCATKKQTEEK
jgi:hypothetical protein